MCTIKRNLSFLLALLLCLSLAAPALASGELEDVTDSEITDVSVMSATQEETPLRDEGETPLLDAESDWSAAFRSFVLNETYRTMGQTYYTPDSYHPIDFALHDLDGDGVPELIVFNGGNAMAETTWHVYQYKNGEIVYLGRIGFRSSVFMYAPDSSYCGLFFQSGNMGYYPGYYYCVEDGVLREEQIVMCTLISYDPTEMQIERTTSDEKLFDTFHASYMGGDGSGPENVELPFYTLSEIRSGGWDAFVAHYAPRPSAPGAVALRGEIGSVTVSWDDVTDADQYAVYRRIGSGAWEQIATVTGVSYTDTSPRIGSLEYRVRAYDAASDQWSGYSNTATIAYNPFSDVPESVSYFKYVAWAYNNSIVKGTSQTTFSPNADCTRGQFALMLYRLAGKPDVTGVTNPFKDVKQSASYYKAILWAFDQGIIKGTSATTFNPNGSVTRGQIVLMLYRMAGKPTVTNTTNPFTDVSNSDSCYKAVLWAVEQGITKGTSATTFSPDKNCTRYQLVTFLYRFNDLMQYI